MSGHAERLQELLARVQGNRAQSRDEHDEASAGPVVVSDPPIEIDPFASMAPAPFAAAPKASPHPASPPGTAAATPLELAIEDEVVRASREPVRAAAPSPAAPAQAAPAASAQGRTLADPAPMAVSRPIAQSGAKHPPASGQTFGDLLRRSLSLRPR
jgi:hypothetical protein